MKVRTGDELLLTCPRGHKLPKRVKNRGRCTPDECCVSTTGAHGAVKVAHAAGPMAVAETNGFAEETERLLDARGRMSAWDQHHPLPRLGEAPKLKQGQSVFAYLRERTAQAAPLALERIIRKALLVPGPQGDAAADNILDRVGFTRKGDAPIEFNGPVSIINLDPSRVPLLRQKADVEGEFKQLPPQGAVHGEQVSGDEEGESDVAASAGDDGAGAGEGERKS